MKRIKNEEMADYIGHDLFGYEYNQKYPPNKKLYGDNFGGYASPNREAFFYDFCIQRYGVAFSYKDEDYEAVFTDDGPVLHNLTKKNVQGPFDDAIALIEHGKLDDHILIDVIDKIEYLVIH